MRPTALAAMAQGNRAKRAIVFKLDIATKALAGIHRALLILAHKLWALIIPCRARNTSPGPMTAGTQPPY
uniref:Uncharacterized protein n=1 Tax=Marinobacter nauticus TaxID=2743 RepID=A0A455W1V0_MARNT|nr:hypothetical protein YBY_10120 [Marinobacter nauticus]